jgi:quinol-cytochrome oxidoreductase complex cytochrome b subunit
MRNLEQNVLDRLIDQFSYKDLRKRVWAIAIVGFVLCAAIAIGGYFFLNTDFTVTAGFPSVPFWKLLWMSK